jgi:prepilin-type N-terminal cleavage/methylation domain-containing protein/prepilin-type processing-associated H-X9-DG protein
MTVYKAMRPGCKGFTLIELLVVIAIIAILSAILFPVFAQARAKARQAACLSNVRQMALAVQMYHQDFESYPMYAVPGVVQLRWFDQILPYTKSADMFSCPSTGRSWSFGPEGRNATYGYNYQYLGNSRGDCSNLPVTEAQISTPANTIAVADSAGTGTRSCLNDKSTDADWTNTACKFNHGYSIDPPQLPPCQSGSGPNKFGTGGTPGLPTLIDARHSNGANIAFCDGHAKWMRPEEWTRDNRWWNGRFPDPNP